MRAVTIVDGELLVAEQPDPRPGHHEALVRVHAAGLNGVDQIQRIGLYPPPPGAGVSEAIPGLEVAGEILEVGRDVTRFTPGDRVMALVAGAGQAELAVVHESQLMPIPDSLDWAQAGGLPETFITAYDAVFNQGNLECGERLLVHGAAGGVGNAAVQLGAVAGALVTATVRTQSNHGAVFALGAHHVIDPDGFVEHGPFDVIVDPIGASNLNNNLLSLDTDGRIAFVSMSGGANGDLNLGLLMFKRGRISSASLRSRPIEEKAMLARKIEAHALPHIASGRISVPIDSTFALDDVGAAYERFRASGKFGKVVLTMPERSH
jgi:NADPH:quinone reductase